MSGLKNQFYKDNAPNYDEFKALSSVFAGLDDIFDEMISQAIDNSKIPTMRAFTKIPIQIINVVDACYSLSTLLANKEVLTATGIDPNLSIHERINIWNDLDPKIRAAVLDQLGLVLLLVNPNILRDENSYTDTFKVVDFEMYDYATGDRLIYGLDYYYEYNKIYFLRFGSHTNKYNNKKIILKNITIDNNIPEKILGESLGIYANSNFSPTEYKDVITSFASAALAGPVISRINQSFNPDTALDSVVATYGERSVHGEPESIRVLDYKSADKVRKLYWDKEVDGIRRLNNYDFLLMIPSEYLYKTEKMEYIDEFIKTIKPAQANFVMCPAYSVKDALSMKHLNFDFKTQGYMTGIKDNVKYKSNKHRLAKFKNNDKFTDIAEYKEEMSSRSSHTKHDAIKHSEVKHLLSAKTLADDLEYADSLKSITKLIALDKTNIISLQDGKDVLTTNSGIMLDVLELGDNSFKAVDAVFLDTITKRSDCYHILNAGTVYDKISAITKHKQYLKLSSHERVYFSQGKSLGVDAVVMDNTWYDSIIFYSDTYKKISTTTTDSAKIKDKAVNIKNVSKPHDKLKSSEQAKAKSSSVCTDKVITSIKANTIICDTDMPYGSDEYNSLYLDEQDDSDEITDIFFHETISLRFVPNK